MPIGAWNEADQAGKHGRQMLQHVVGKEARVGLLLASSPLYGIQRRDRATRPVGRAHGLEWTPEHSDAALDRRKYRAAESLRAEFASRRANKEFYRPAGCASQLTGPGCEVADCTPSAPSTVARHWARDWRALALTQVHHGSRLSDSREGGTARHLLSSERALARPPPPHHRQAHSQSLCDCRDQRIFQRMYF